MKFVNQSNDKPVLALDIGGVLIPYLDNVIDRDIQKTLGLGRDAFIKLWVRHTPPLITGKISESAFWVKIEEDLGYSIFRKNDLFIKAYIDNLSINYDLIKIANNVRHKFKLIALSNSIEPHSNFNRKIGLYDVFDRVYLSNEVGFMKPDTDIYELVVKDLGCSPSNIYFFDDNPLNLKSAKRFGINSFLYRSNADVTNFLLSY